MPRLEHAALRILCALTYCTSLGLAVLCATDGSDASMSITVANGLRTISTTNCPGYDWSSESTPNNAEKFTNYQWKVPTSVQVCKSDALDQIPYVDRNAMDASNLGLGQPVMGTLGIALDGVVIFGPTDAELAADGQTGRNAIVFEGNSLGHCGSHATGADVLHYHAHPGMGLPQCTVTCSPSGRDAGPDCNRNGILCPDVIPVSTTMCTETITGEWAAFSSQVQTPAQAFGTGAASAGDHSLLLGFMADGVPMYGLFGSDGTEPSDLDSCNGHSSDLAFYHYHATRAYPYTVSCLRGRMLQANNQGVQKWKNELFRMSNSCTSGYNTYDYSDILPSWSYPVTSPSSETSSTTSQQSTTSETSTASLDSTTATFSTSTHSGRSPNFIIFQTDDMPFYDDWNPPANAPASPNTVTTNPGCTNMARIMDEGTKFTNAYVVSPACGTSRFATLTGVYPSRSERGREKTIQTNPTATRTYTTIPYTKLQGVDLTQNVVATLSASGYRTGVVGKWHLAEVKNNQAFPSYADQQSSIRAAGFDWADGIYLENIDGSFAGTGTFSHNLEWVTAKAVEFIQGTDADQPFYLYYNPTVPHSPSVIDALDNYDCTQTPAGDLSSEPQVKGMTSGTTCAQYRNTLKNRATTDSDLGSLWSDDALGALITALSDKGILDNTFILIMMDHGIEAKMTLWENGNRVMMAARYPPLFQARTQFAGHITNLDLARTVLDIAGVAPSYTMDGVSFAAEVEVVSKTGSSANQFWTTRCLFFEYEYDRAARCGCYKMLSFPEPSSSSTLTEGSKPARGYSTTTPMQFYNLCEDGSESTDLGSSDPQASVLQNAIDCHDLRTAPGSTSSFFGCSDDIPTTASSSTSSAGSSSIGSPSTSLGSSTTRISSTNLDSTVSTIATTRSNSGSTAAPVTSTISIDAIVSTTSTTRSDSGRITISSVISTTSIDAAVSTTSVESIRISSTSVPYASTSSFTSIDESSVSTSSSAASSEIREPSVFMQLRVNGLDYDKFIANSVAKAKLEDDIKSSVLSNLASGYTTGHIRVTFSKGSVKADVAITPLANADSSSLGQSLEGAKTAIRDAAMQSVVNLPNVENLLETGATLSDVSVSANSAVSVTSTLKFSSDASSASLGTRFYPADCVFLFLVLCLY